LRPLHVRITYGGIFVRSACAGRAAAGEFDGAGCGDAAEFLDDG
jgi:hypothetical protein